MLEITNILQVVHHIYGTKGVIFDLDDTLYSEKQYVRSGYKAVAKLLGDETLADRLWTYFEKQGHKSRDYHRWTSVRTKEETSSVGIR